MKIKGPLPDVKPTPHHPDEVSPGQLRLAAARAEAAIAGYRNAEFAIEDLLSLMRDSLHLIEHHAPAFAPAAEKYELSSAQARQRIEEGLFLLDPDKLSLPHKPLRALLDEVLEMAGFPDQETKVAMKAWGEKLSAKQEDLAALTRLNVNRQKDRIDQQAAAAGVAKPVFWFVMHQLGVPVLYALAAHLAGWIDSERWYRGACPICGNWPAMAGLVGDGGKRHLFCDSCGMVWTFPRLKCPYCHNEDVNQLEVLNLDDQSPYALDVCRQCQRYVKTVDYRKADPAKAVLLPVEDAATVYLDILASNEGLKRE